MCNDPNHAFCSHGLSRRDFARIFSLASLAMVLPGCGQSKNNSSSAGPVLTIGYIPITDATPVLIGHA